jgi:phospholipid transport system substrate-binding protein
MPPQHYGVIRLLWVLCALTLWWPGMARAEEAPPAGAMQVVREAVEGLREALKQRGATAQDTALVAQLVEQEVVPHVDVSLSGRLILGRHWRAASEAERAGFIEAYRQMLLRTYAIHAMAYLEASVDYQSVAPLGSEPGRYTVRTRVLRPGRKPARVDYRIGLRDGEFKVFDALVNGVSLVSTLRTAVDAEISRIGLPALIAQLQSGVAAAPAVPTANDSQ